MMKNIAAISPQTKTTMSIKKLPIYREIPSKAFLIPKNACKYLQQENTRRNEDGRENSGR
jgi:hypothetical protein